MNWIKITTVAVVVAVAPAVTRAAVEKPQIMEEAMISITVSDLHGFLDEVGNVAAQISPMMNGPMIKNMVGMQLGDPGLAGIPTGSGLSIVAMDPTNIFAVIEVAEAQSAGYISVAQSVMLQAKYANGVLVLAGTPEALAMGAEKSGKVKSALLTKRSPELCLAMQPAAMIERNQEAIDGFMQMMPAMLGQSMMSAPGATLESTQATTEIMEGEMIVGMSLAKQCATAEIKLTPKGGSVQLSKTIVPKAGTALAKLVNAPVVNKENPKIHSGLLDKGTILMDFYFANPEALGEFVATEVEQLMKELQLEDVDADALTANLKKWFELYGIGTGSEMVSFGGADGQMSIQYVTEVSDPAASLNLLKNMDKDMAPFFKMYESFGMPITTAFKENVRESDGIKVNELSMSFDFSGMAPEQRQQMELMGLSNIVYEVAVDNNLMLYSGKGEMEALIKRVKSGASTQSPLKARAVYPKGGFYYFDLDMGDYMTLVSRMLPASPETAMMKQQMSTLFEGVDPLTSAGFKQNGCVMWSVNIPSDLLAKYGQMIMMAQMQQMQQQPGMAPQGMPVQ
ncbi:hypothetical protein P4C99_15490 [Pontiellaceae bacterium B1224]|nr:hypothetical protein [Pontiellaceae bacterium B1224]